MRRKTFATSGGGTRASQLPERCEGRGSGSTPQPQLRLSGKVTAVDVSVGLVAVALALVAYPLPVLIPAGAELQLAARSCVDANSHFPSRRATVEPDENAGSTSDGDRAVSRRSYLGEV